MTNLHLTHLGGGEFDVYDEDANKRYVADARSERDGNEYDDPCYWATVTVHDVDGNVVDELDEAILNLLNDRFDDLASDMCLEDDIVRADTYAFRMRRACASRI